MEKNKFKSIVSVLLMIIFLAACSSPATSSPTETQVIKTQTPPATPTEIATEPPATSEGAGTSATGEDLCANAYYPVREGSTWTYKSTGGPTGEYSFTDTITSVGADGFTLSSQFGDLTRTQEWACKPEGLVALQLGGTSAATLNSENMQLNLEVKNVSGVTYPSEMNVGDQWQHNLDFEGKMTVASRDIRRAKDPDRYNPEYQCIGSGNFGACYILRILYLLVCKRCRLGQGQRHRQGLRDIFQRDNRAAVV